jgi:DNA-binding response OmpR family regulator
MPMNKCHILLALSDKALCEPLRHLLISQGFKVETASGGLECLLKLCQVVPEMMVLDEDILWGGGDGVLAALRAGEVTFWPPVLFLSREHGEAFPAMRESPVVACLQKPVRFYELLANIDNVLPIEKLVPELGQPDLGTAKAEQGGDPHFSFQKSSYS